MISVPGFVEHTDTDWFTQITTRTPGGGKIYRFDTIII